MLIAFTMITIIVASTVASAHRRDEYLQAARIGIERDRVVVRLDLTPGIAVADAIVTDIDRNRDGVLAIIEKQAYIQRVLSAITIEVDGHPLNARRLDVQMIPVSSFPDADAFRRGEGTITLRWITPLPALSDGAHQLAWRNAFHHDDAVYLANALSPDSNEIEIRAQHRDPDQRDLTIDFAIHNRQYAWDRLYLLSSLAIALICVAKMRRTTY